MAGLVVTPAALIGGWLYYFGWVRTGAIFAHFGIEQTMLGYGSQDYLLRSAGVAFLPFLVMVLAGGAVLVTHFLVMRWKGRVVACSVGAAGVLLVLVGVLAAFRLLAGVAPLAGATALGVGALLVESAALLAELPEARVARRLVVGGLLLVSTFWACAAYAQAVGNRLATDWERNPDLRPAVTVISKTELGIGGPGTAKQKLGGGAGFRYSGLRLLVYSKDRWFLIPAGWTGDPAASALIVRDADGIRVELSPGGRG